MPRSREIYVPDRLGVLFAHAGDVPILHAAIERSRTRAVRQPQPKNVRRRFWLPVALVWIGACLAFVFVIDFNKVTTWFDTNTPLVLKRAWWAMFLGVAVWSLVRFDPATRSRRVATKVIALRRKRLARALRDSDDWVAASAALIPPDPPVPQFFDMTLRFPVSNILHIATHSPGANLALRALLFGPFVLSLAIKIANPEDTSGSFNAIPGSIFVWVLAGLALLVSIPVSASLIRPRAERRIADRCCPHCGYSLKGVPLLKLESPARAQRLGPESCPECGCPYPLVPAPAATMPTRIIP